jgi:hypothetical protein
LDDLYREVELYLLANESYTQALVAEQANNLNAQATAHVGLVYTDVASGDNGETKTLLNIAIILYRENGQPTMAEQVEAELNKFQ